MLFNSFPFLFLFLPVTLIGFQLISRLGARAVISWLAFMSLVFYARWRPAFLILLASSIAMNYTVSRLIWKTRENARAQKTVLVAGIAANLLILGYFKYFFPLLNFGHRIGVFTHGWANIILPLGISFFTFTQIGYLVDLQDGEAEPQDLVNYTLFVTFFPHLIAGPILHHKEMMPQFAATRRFSLSWDDMSVGLSWFVLGLAKKVLIADRIAPVADFAFANSASLLWSATWIGVIAYALQLYFDFSGYSDMALGLARMFGIRFPINFNSPYKAANIVDFWQRWHMTLTRYLTLYLFNPMAMSIRRRRAAAGKSISKKAAASVPGFLSLIALPTIATMFLAGIWHGAGLTFIIFGTLHGIYIATDHAWRTFRSPGSWFTRFISFRPVSVLITFVCVCVGHVFFRAASMSEACGLVAGMLGLHNVHWPAPIADHLGIFRHVIVPRSTISASAYSTSDLLSVLVLMVVVLALPNTQEILGQVEQADEPKGGALTFIRWRPNLAWSAALGCALVLIFAYMTNTSSFIYFQF